MHSRLVRFVSLATLIVVLTATLAACAPATPETVEKVVKETVVVEKEVEKVVKETVVVEKEVEVVVTATPAPVESAGGAMRVGVMEDIRTLDPHKTTGSADKPAFNVFNALTRGGVNGEALPELAESWENPDPTTYIFHLQQGVTFHNGREFVADDVIFSFNRVLDPETGSRYRNQLTQIDTMEAVDDYTLKITLTEPYAPFLVYLQDVRIVPEEAADELASHPIGTGAFEFVEWVPNDHLTLAKNENYWEEGLPVLDEVVFQVTRDKQSALIALQTGDLDMIASPLTPKDVLQVQDQEDIVLHTVPVEAYYDLLLFDCEHPPTDDPRVRRAIAHALDRELISEVVYEGMFPPAHTIFPPEHWAYDPYLLQPEYDLEKAKALFEEAGVTELTFHTWSTFPEYKQHAEILQQELASIGVDLEIIALETSQFIEAVYPTDKTYNIANTGYLREIDPDGWLKYYYSEEASAGNETNYNNPELDAVLIQARSELDQEKRKELYKEAQRIIIEDMPKLILVFHKSFIAAHDYVKNLSIPYKGDEAYIREVWLDK